MINCSIKGPTHSYKIAIYTYHIYRTPQSFRLCLASGKSTESREYFINKSLSMSEGYGVRIII